MKTLYLTNSSANIAVDTENNSVCTLNNEDRYNIRNIYYAEEPMHVVFDGTCNGEEVHEEIDAKKGDLIIQFYQDRFNKTILSTVKCKAWMDNIKNRRKIEQKEREEWAAKNATKCECECNDCDAWFKV